MAIKKKRTYDSAGRKEQALKSRKRILEAAKKLFERKGFDHVTIDELAQAAEISAQSIYAIFQSKRGILRTLLDEALAPERFDALVQQVNQEACPAKRLALAAQIARQLYDAERKKFGFFQSLSILDPEIKQVELEREERRYMRQDESMKVTAKLGVLAPGITLAKAKDILWALTGRDLYRMLVIQRKWSSAHYEKWLADTLVSTILAKD